ncbi:MAG: DnaT-like ssDNA-binding protein [Lysobacterales bacterium]
MALVAETGECVPTANAFVTRDELIAYAADYQPSVTVPDDTTTDAAILRASAWLSSYPDWDGSLSCGRGLQGLAWPRSGVQDCNGEDVEDDVVPPEVMLATYIAALAELATPGLLAPTITPGAQQKRVKVDVIEVEYITPVDQGVGGVYPETALRPVLTAVRDLLRCMASFETGLATPWPWVA